MTNNHNFYIIHKYRCTTEYNTNLVIISILGGHSGLELNQGDVTKLHQDS